MFYLSVFKFESRKLFAQTAVFFNFRGCEGLRESFVRNAIGYSGSIHVQVDCVFNKDERLLVGLEVGFDEENHFFCFVDKDFR